MSDIHRLTWPITIWLAAFCAVYGLHGLLCSSRFAGAFGDGTGRALLIAAALAALAVQAGLVLALRGPRWGGPPGTIRTISLTLASVALVATAWTLIPVVATSHCL
ncbi:hypothetical protein [Wenxinia saemankumensis]|uniref:Uncharacterized protein n=1 Tax=Wenxinia saemankumensis TaxID=1447782 RepID=A0A1M6B0V2_9RHOB|nr:hypothetical protein [Wenxinia saemankumensis]SHI42321.1 hypothetical protein SAMN05444417_0722 [Wenxinia saemankumensis]